VIQVIAGGTSWRGFEDRKRTRDARDSCSLVAQVKNPILSFSDTDLPQEHVRDNEPLVIAASMAGFEVHRIFVDQGNSADVMFWSVFDKLGLGSKDLTPHKGSLIGFTGDIILPNRYVDLKVLFGQKPDTKAVMPKIIVVDCPSAYNAILGRPTLNHLGAIVSTVHLAMKFPGEDGSVITVRGKGSDARRWYQESLKITKTPIQPVEIHEGKGKKKMERRDSPHEAGVMMTNLDPRANFEEQGPQLEGEQILV
jgi:hypothetical protein